MCLILHKPKGITFDRDKMLSTYQVNPDGFGYTYFDKGDNQIKSFKTLDYKAEDCADVVESFKNFDAMFHWRFKTHGVLTEEQCHPFQILNKAQNGMDMWFMHNGVINISAKEAEQGELEGLNNPSDTQIFNELILKPVLKVKPNLIKTEAFHKLIEKYIGTGSKLAFMYGKGETVILNKKLGADTDGCWVSNTYSFNRNHRTSTFVNKNNKFNNGGGYSNGQPFRRSNYTNNSKNEIMGVSVKEGSKVTVFKQGDSNFVTEGIVKFSESVNQYQCFVEFKDTQEKTKHLAFFKATGKVVSNLMDQFYIVPPRQPDLVNTKSTIEDFYKKKTPKQNVIGLPPPKQQEVKEEESKEEEDVDGTDFRFFLYGKHTPYEISNMTTLQRKNFFKNHPDDAFEMFEDCLIYACDQLDIDEDEEEEYDFYNNGESVPLLDESLYGCYDDEYEFEYFQHCKQNYG